MTIQKNYNIIVLPSTQWTNISDYLKPLTNAVCIISACRWMWRQFCCDE